MDYSPSSRPQNWDGSQGIDSQLGYEKTIKEKRNISTVKPESWCAKEQEIIAELTDKGTDICTISVVKADTFTYVVCMLLT